MRKHPVTFSLRDLEVIIGHLTGNKVGGTTVTADENRLVDAVERVDAWLRPMRSPLARLWDQPLLTELHAELDLFDPCPSCGEPLRTYMSHARGYGNIDVLQCRKCGWERRIAGEPKPHE